ncbi:MAG: hypothetical protein KDD51_07100 [Bdellovibrionales bacterium]|nr:hypothetical protein [Bdellovibrionales bacterium]
MVSIATESTARTRNLQALKHAVGLSPSRAHIELAIYLDSASREKPPAVDRFLTNRWTLLALSTALELRAEEVLRAGWEKLLQERDRAVPALLSEGALHPEIVTGLQGMETRHSLWLSGRSFPLEDADRFLRQVLAAPKGGAWNPGLMGTGMGLFFFGQDQMVVEFPLRNVLEVAHPSPTELLELSLRCTRAARLTERLRDLAMEPNQAHLDQLEEDCFRLFALLQGLQYS